MAAPEERQGYLGNLAQKTREELTELLRRQKNLAANSKFLSCLPDKGERINQMIDKIEKTLEERTNIDQTAELFNDMAIKSERSRSQRSQVSHQETELLRSLANRGQEKEIVDERMSSEKLTETEVTETNSYEKIMKKSGEKAQPKGKFRPNRSLRTKDLRQLPERDVVTLAKPNEQPLTSNEPASSLKMDTSSSSPNKRTAKTLAETLINPKHDILLGRLHHRYDELLEEKLYTGESHCESAKLIDIEDSVELQKAQQRKLEEIQAKHAAEKLAQRLNVKMESFNPEGSSLDSRRYREAKLDEDEAESPDEDDLDYPD